MSHHDQAEVYREYVYALSATEDGAEKLIDFLFDLVEMHPVQANAWLKGALDFPMETLSKIMGGMDFSDWSARQESERVDAAVDRAVDERVDAMEGRR